MSERIILRACSVTGERGQDKPGFWACAAIMLPDGRIIMAGSPTNETSQLISTFSSEAALQRQYPGAVVRFIPEADAIVNAVSEPEAHEDPDLP